MIIISYPKICTTLRENSGKICAILENEDIRKGFKFNQFLSRIGYKASKFLKDSFCVG